VNNIVDASKLWYPSYGIQATILNNKMLDGRLRSDMTAACSNQAWRFLYLKNCVKTRTARFRNLKNPGLKPSYGLELGPKVGSLKKGRTNPCHKGQS
jgi:hypothetical protein